MIGTPISPSIQIVNSNGDSSEINPPSLLDLPSEVVVSLFSIVGKEDVLDETVFNVEDALNDLFPDEASLSRIDIVQTRLRNCIQKQRLETSGQVERLQRDGQADDHMASLQELIGELLTQIHHLRTGATESEVVVREITRDIRSLDLAKKNLVSSMTSIKKFQMLVNAFDQLTRLARAKRYRETAHSLAAVRDLAATFKTFTGVERISTLYKGIQEVQGVIRDQVMQDFQNSLSQESMSKIQRNLLLNDACLVIDSLGYEARNGVLSWYCNLELKEYRRIFRPTDEAGQLDNLPRRFAWLKRLLRQHDEDRAAMFPKTWNVAGSIVSTFSAITSDHLNTVLAKAGSALSVSLLLEGLQSTQEFEREMVKRFGTTFETIVSYHSPAVVGKPGPITDVFEPHLGIFVDAQDKVLSDMMSSYRKPLPAAPVPSGDEDGSTTNVLPSSTELFYYYRETLERCAKLSTRTPFADLCRVYAKWLRVYAEDVLVAALTGNNKTDLRRSSSSEGRLNIQHITNSCLVLNTADYCSETAEQLDERLREKIHPDFKDKVSLESEREVLLSVISAAITTLVHELELSCEPAFTAMSRSPWKDVELVTSESKYVTEMVRTLDTVVGIVKGRVEQKRYFRSFCDRVANLITAKFTSTIVRCRPISRTAAEQLILDLQSLKSCLLRLPSASTEDSSVPQGYNRLVNKAVGRIETLLKAIMASDSPPEDFVSHYLLLIPCQSFSDFQKMLDLKGVRRTDQNALLDVFLARTSTMSDLADSSFLSSIDMDGVSALSGLGALTPMTISGAPSPSIGAASSFLNLVPSLPSTANVSRAPTPLARTDTLDVLTGPSAKQQFDLRRFSQGLRAGVRLFNTGRDGER